MSRDLVAAPGPWLNHDFYVSGPPATVPATLRRLESAHVPPARIRFDALTSP